MRLTGEMCVFRLGAPVSGGLGEEVIGRMQGSLKGEKSRGVGQVVGGGPGRFGGRG